MRCSYYSGDSRGFIKCLEDRKDLCDRYCVVEGENRLRKYDKLKNDIKPELYEEETCCFICGTIIDESIEHIYPQSQNKRENKLFLDSCPSNFRRACTACNGDRGNEWSGFNDEQIKAHKHLQTYSVINDENIYFNFEEETFEFDESNAYSIMYLNESAEKKFKKLYQIDYECGFESIEVNPQMQYYKILENTIKKEKNEI